MTSLDAMTKNTSHKKKGLCFLASVILVVQLASWRGTSRLRATSSVQSNAFPRSNLATPARLQSRNEGQSAPIPRAAEPFDTHISSANNSFAHNSFSNFVPCQPLPTHASPQSVCQHVRRACPQSGHLNYLEFYYCIGISEISGEQQTKAKATTPTVLLSHMDSQKPFHKRESTVDTRLTLLRAIALFLIITWMLFLFSWVGIVASDFFCPNLSTIAARLGLSESTAGVTFLAFGNGSPDVFSTFGAMRTGSGTLAIGELIGAASFIVSVISGSMMLIAPFRVKRYPFLRDVGFFTVAVALTMVFLFDGKLLLSECLSLIGLYLAYAATIIVGSWWQERQRTRRHLLDDIREEYSSSASPGRLSATIDAEHQISPDVSSRLSPSFPPQSAVEYDPEVDPFSTWAAQQDSSFPHSPHSHASSSASPLLQPHDLPTSGTSSSGNNRLQRFRAGMLARHSLLGAVEFRDVVRNLQNESTPDRSAEVYQSRDPESFLPHQHTHVHMSRTPSGKHKRNQSAAGGARSTSDGNIKPSLHRSHSTVEEARSAVQPDLLSPPHVNSGQPSSMAGVADALGDPWREHAPNDTCDTSPLPPPAIPIPHLKSHDDQNHIKHTSKPSLPRLVVRQATQQSGDSPGRRTQSRSISSLPEVSSWEGVQSLVKSILKVLFPSLRHMKEKSWLGVAIGVITAPAIFLLSITLPVVDDAAERNLLGGHKSDGIMQSPLGRVRLEGDEAQINAYSTSDGNESDDEDYGRGIITLSSNTSENPWTSVSGSDDPQNAGNGTEINRKRHLEIGSALRQTTQGGPANVDISPRPYQHSNDGTSLSSQQSCDSTNSHTATQSSHISIVITQCILAPPFCMWAITSSAKSKHVASKTFFAFLGGVTFAALVLLIRLKIRYHSRDGLSLPIRLIAAVGWGRVSLGFFVSILYIMTIVDEVVSILQTLGVILGLSDAILGLTIFAMGNSLGDLVANITIAKMGHPVMAISACFAGPLLNLLLGIGISGSWLLLRNQPIPHDHHPPLPLASLKKDEHMYLIDFSPTLTVSGIGLLLILAGTLISVPLNGFFLNRRIGFVLIISYAVIMITNVGVEIYHMHSST